MEDGLRELHLLEPEVADRRAERRLSHREADRNAEREEAVDQRLAELGLRRRVEVDVQRLWVHRQAREPYVVGLGDSAPRLVPERLSDRELLEVLSGHEFPPLGVRRPGLTAAVPDSINGGPWKTLSTSPSSAAASSGSPPRAPSVSVRRVRAS